MALSSLSQYLRQDGDREDDMNPIINIGVRATIRISFPKCMRRFNNLSVGGAKPFAYI